jgi:hypothetical protein
LHLKKFDVIPALFVADSKLIVKEEDDGIISLQLQDFCSNDEWKDNGELIQLKIKRAWQLYDALKEILDKKV